jgi:hypothetical protein
VKKQQTLRRRIRTAQGSQCFDLDWILSFFVLLDDQIARESAGLEPATSAVQQRRPRHALAGKQLLACGENLVPTEGWGDRSQNRLYDVRIVGNTKLIWDG